ncbi:MAG: hypothetical protein R3222_00100 [Balneolaceae bacterium]|nr:hypothetical protein [Balneolaceae bacterium]
MPRCAFLTMNCLDEFEVYDELLIEPLSHYGWTVDMVSWRDPNPGWDQYDVVLIRSPWDYQQDVKAFLEVLADIDRSSALLENPLPLVKWNIDKFYLEDMADKGVRVVPTLWKDHFVKHELMDAFDHFETGELIIKPRVSANADHTYRVTRDMPDDTLQSLTRTFSDRPFMIQPFMDHIVTEGEFSLFIFGDHYSHTILKTPKEADFRVQEEHGGRLTRVEPEKPLLERSMRAMNQIDPSPLYARVDMVRTDDHDFALMELELIEPSLYFNMDPDSPDLFAKVFDEWVRGRQ